MNLSAQVTIASGASQSEALDAREFIPTVLLTPAAWDAAAITFLVSERRDGTYLPLYDSFGAEVSVTVAVSRAIALDPTTFAGLRFFKLRSGTAGTPVNQTAARAITIIGTS